jgi:uncharacterized membrane protein
VGERQREATVPKYFSIRPTWTLKGRKFNGIRGWKGKPSHPPLTDFPIVCYALTAAFDVVGYLAGRSASASRIALSRHLFIAASLVLIIGFVVSLATALTGFMDWWKGMPRDRTGPIGKAKHTQVWRTANWHMTVMLTVTAIVIVDIAVRLGHFHHGHASLAVTILSILAGALVLFGAGYGGTLVFEYQFNVESLKGSTAWDETDVDQFPGKKTPPPAPPAGDAPA